MNIPDNATVIICAPTEEVHEPVRGSVRSNCSQCRRPIWFTPRDLPEDLSLMAVWAVCWNCARSLYRQRPADVDMTKQSRGYWQSEGYLPHEIDEALTYLNQWLKGAP